MEELTSVLTIGLVSGSAIAAHTYGVQSDQDFANGGIGFQTATQFVDNEFVELSGSSL